MLGLDTLYWNEAPDDRLAALSAREVRVLLAQDRGLLKRGDVTYGYLVRQHLPERQLLEVVRRFGLERATAPFTRCMRCNGMLQPVAKADILDQLEPLTREHYDEFWRCESCEQIYWRGSHYEHMLDLIERTVGEAGSSSRNTR
jgi:uncharacterized protein with PIN domain